MILIGEKINGAIPAVAKAIEERDAESIRERALAQAAAGADYIDVCASVEDDSEIEVLRWLIEQVQAVCELPVCIDSPNAGNCVEAMSYCSRPGMINSVSMEGDKIDVVFPHIADTQWKCIALLCAKEIPSSARERLNVFADIMQRAKAYGIEPSRLCIDPMVEMLCTSKNGIEVVVQVMREIRKQYLDVHILGAVSNISFNLPLRRILNQTFAALAVNAGMDSAVLDPTDKDLLGTILAAEAMLGRDMFCMEYIKAYRLGRLCKPKI